jgi:hypothetical protein
MAGKKKQFMVNLGPNDQGGFTASCYDRKDGAFLTYEKGETEREAQNALINKLSGVNDYFRMVITHGDSGLTTVVTYEVLGR